MCGGLVVSCADSGRRGGIGWSCAWVMSAGAAQVDHCGGIVGLSSLIRILQPGSVIPFLLLPPALRRVSGCVMRKAKGFWRATLSTVAASTENIFQKGFTSGF